MTFPFKVPIQKIINFFRLIHSIKLYTCIKGREESQFKGIFLTYETDFALFSAVLENSVLPMG